MRLILSLALVAVASAATIYPDDHWTYTKKLTSDTFESEVRTVIDAGKTMFAPAWNRVVSAFAENPDVEFGDVAVGQQIEGPHNPGAGGWPTIRYFNKETGIDGSAYTKVTSGSMCDELGKDEHMTEYVEAYGKTSLCAAESLKGCGEKEVEYIGKMKARVADDQKKQLERLEGMDGSAMKPELKDWLDKRIKILKQLTSAPTGEL